MAHAVQLHDRIWAEDCPVCLARMDVPVALKGTYPCCTTLPDGILVCIACARAYLTLDKPREERGAVKHPICHGRFDAWALNALSAYTVPVAAMRRLDREGRTPPPCSKCHQAFDSYIALYAHRSPSTPHLHKDERARPSQVCTAIELPVALVTARPFVPAAVLERRRAARKQARDRAAALSAEAELL